MRFRVKHGDDIKKEAPPSGEELHSNNKGILRVGEWRKRWHYERSSPMYSRRRTLIKKAEPLLTLPLMTKETV